MPDITPLDENALKLELENLQPSPEPVVPTLATPTTPAQPIAQAPATQPAATPVAPTSTPQQTAPVQPVVAQPIPQPIQPTEEPAAEPPRTAPAPVTLPALPPRNDGIEITGVSDRPYSESESIPKAVIVALIASVASTVTYLIYSQFSTDIYQWRLETFPDMSTDVSRIITWATLIFVIGFPLLFIPAKRKWVAGTGYLMGITSYLSFISLATLLGLSVTFSKTTLTIAQILASTLAAILAVIIALLISKIPRMPKIAADIAGMILIIALVYGTARYIAPAIQTASIEASASSTLTFDGDAFSFDRPGNLKCSEVSNSAQCTASIAASNGISRITIDKEDMTQEAFAQEEELTASSPVVSLGALNPNVDVTYEKSVDEYMLTSTYTASTSIEYNFLVKNDDNSYTKLSLTILATKAKEDSIKAVAQPLLDSLVIK